MKRFGIILLGALAILMAGCSKDAHTASSPDPDAWMYNETLPVPIRFSSGDLLATKAAAINSPEDMVGKEFGFFATHNNMATLSDSNGLDMPQNALGTCVAVPESNPATVQFNFEGGPFYYPQTSINNYTFYGYYARVTENVSPQAERIVVVTEVGKTDILWAKAVAEPFDLKNEDNTTTTYEGFNARYIRKSQSIDADNDGTADGVIKHPFMTFKHLTSCVTFKAKTEFSAFAESNPGKDRVTITKVSVLNTLTRGRLIVAHKDEALEGTFETIRKGELSSEITDGILTEEPKVLTEDPFFIAPAESITIRLDYDVIPEDGAAVKSFSSEYVLTPEVQNGDKAGQTGFFAGYKYTYNFIVYTPERIGIEATVEPYVSAFGDDEYEDVYPENE